MNLLNRFFVSNLKVKEKRRGRVTGFYVSKHGKTWPDWDMHVGGLIFGARTFNKQGLKETNRRQITSDGLHSR